MLKPQEIRYGTDRGLVSSSQAFASGDWRKSKIFVQYPDDLCIWVNGNAKESWEIEHEGAAHNLPPFGWLAIGADDFYECSETIDEKRYDRASSPECIFIDGRGSWCSFDGIATSGSVAVRRAKKSKGLSIITVEGVDRLVIAEPGDTFTPDDVRAAIRAAARATAIAARAFDLNDKDLGEVAIKRTESGWELKPPASAVRLEVAAK
jgi:hypothetical protein